MYKILVSLLLLNFLDQCSEEKNNPTSSQDVSSSIAQSIAEVRVKQVETKAFNAQIITNGKIEASQQSKLLFRGNGIIEKITVKNGDFVKEGQILAVLDNSYQKLHIKQTENKLAETQIDINDLLVRSGGKAGDSTSVKPSIYKTIQYQSGYNRVKLDLQEAKMKLNDTYLKAPYSGVIANLKNKAFNPSNASDFFCTIISKNSLSITFMVLESELSMVKIGQVAQVLPNALENKKYKGVVSEINPTVNEQGLVQIKVAISSFDNQLMEGMNAQVIIQKNKGKHLVIPKDAIVERAGRKVVFTYENGLAKWKYVEVANENSTEVAITDGLNLSDKVIITGNLNLGHDAKVKLLDN
ncbi:MAG: efflux RND transporter periplasmic adaptor subunit [Pseudarcicella sp.]|nr:efflux RND transporter periplasmic adaptor subunit [Pseudarcicella sp.]MBP6410771.1 efflux RND transporter periplasmic adaptor subunit [Pseudarcicella sp.]